MEVTAYSIPDYTSVEVETDLEPDFEPDFEITEIIPEAADATVEQDAPTQDTAADTPDVPLDDTPANIRNFLPDSAIHPRIASMLRQPPVRGTQPSNVQKDTVAKPGHGTYHAPTAPCPVCASNNMQNCAVAKPPVNTDHTSPNYDNSRNGKDIDAIIIHHTGADDIQSTFNEFENPYSEVSAHYVIDKDGTIYQIVGDEKRAWHAGPGGIPGNPGDVNNRSIGIEVVNAGDGKTPFTDEQYAALSQLTAYLQQQYQVPDENILGHRDVSSVGKPDPADNFDWDRFKAGVSAYLGPLDGVSLEDAAKLGQEAGNKTTDAASKAALAHDGTPELAESLNNLNGSIEMVEKINAVIKTRGGCMTDAEFAYLKAYYGATSPDTEVINHVVCRFSPISQDPDSKAVTFEGPTSTFGTQYANGLLNLSAGAEEPGRDRGGYNGLPQSVRDSLNRDGLYYPNTSGVRELLKYADPDVVGGAEFIKHLAKR